MGKGDKAKPHGVERSSRVWTCQEVCDGAQRLRSLLAERRIRLHRDSTLGVLLRHAETLTKNWTETQSDDQGVSYAEQKLGHVTEMPSVLTATDNVCLRGLGAVDGSPEGRKHYRVFNLGF